MRSSIVAVIALALSALDARDADADGFLGSRVGATAYDHGFADAPAVKITLAGPFFFGWAGDRWRIAGTVRTERHYGLGATVRRDFVRSEYRAFTLRGGVEWTAIALDEDERMRKNCLNLVVAPGVSLEVMHWAPWQMHMVIELQRDTTILFGGPGWAGSTSVLIGLDLRTSFSSSRL